MSKNNLRGITFGIRPIWAIKSLTSYSLARIPKGLKPLYLVHITMKALILTDFIYGFSSKPNRSRILQAITC